MRIWLIEPYFGGSHQAWAEGYVAHSDYDVELLTLPARFWKWRMQGGAVTLAERATCLSGPPDAILASDMLNLPAFLGLMGGRLGHVPVALYCHENQLTYPVPPGEKRDLTYGMINWLSMVAADRVLFNSWYHLEAWFDELPRMLKHFPDCSHLGHVDAVRAKARVMPVGCDLQRLDEAGPPERGEAPPRILWNQRWEYDKAPREFFNVLYAVIERYGVDFHVALAGRNARQTAAEFETARDRLGERVVHFGYAEPGAYARLLRRADVVVSTAIHEFFGVSIVEAIYAGAFPILPHRLSYPEIIPPAHHADCLYRDGEGLIERLHWAVTHPEQARGVASKLRPTVAPFDWSEMAPRYDAAMEEMVGA